MSTFPVFKQHDAMDCGATCVKMVAKYYGKDFTLDTIRKLCYTVKDGVSLMSISDALENIGFKTIGGKITYEKLIKEAPLPVILHWEGNHFVVLYKVEKARLSNDYKITIADPQKGLITLSAEEFKASWIGTVSKGEEKGIVLMMEPTNLFYAMEEEKDSSTSLKFLYSYIKKYKRFFFQLILGLIIGSLIQLVFPFLTQAIVDKGIRNRDIGFIYIILLAQLALFLGRISVDFLRRWILLHISIRINLSLLSDFLIKLTKLPMSFFDTSHLGDILQRMNDHERVQRFLTTQTLNVLFSAFNLIIFSIVLLFYSYKIFLIFLIGSTVYVLWIFLFLDKRKKLDYKLFEHKAKSSSLTTQLIYGMQEIKLQNCEKRKRWEWEDTQANVFDVHILSLGLEQRQEAGNMIINEIKNILITVFAAIAVINNEMTLGMMLATQYIIGQLNSPIEQSIRLIQDYQDAKISLERINEIHSKSEENDDKQEGDIVLQSNDIHVKDLTFQYEGPHSKKVLNNLNFTIPQGKVTAIVGASGSGKTTLIKLLLQYYNPVEGEIKVGGFDLDDFNSTWWRNQCGAVMQDGFIFSDSIARNIAVSGDEIDKDRLRYAVEMANIRDFIESLPLKYDMMIGNEGQNLSQGQKQRILIARSIYKNPKFLFFDEATNALDANNEKVIVENLQSFYEGKTVVVVAHRLSTVRNADLIIVLDDGQIVEEGTHALLTEKRGYYYELVKNQLELGS
ncbi:MAG: peptidase domain-containing ABC transporter [Salinivirgaceae bacterium]|nr:peptidase domain-containing ABC transporter [Salinivirgaceae bacterium]MDD4746632.1 peptidase domain-containing ABC transporter [Salinivirgaceae bacterium]